MTIYFWPTLQIIAYARLAQAILYTFNLEILKRRFILHMSVYPTYSKAIEEKVNQRSLPPAVQKKLVGVITSLAWEIYNWFECHGHFFEYNSFDLRNKLHWFSCGLIDRQQTAQNFILDVDLNIRERFHLARKYCLEDDMQMLWRNMSADNRFQETYRLSRNGTIEIWEPTIYRNEHLNWEELFNERPFFFFRNYLGMRNYFERLEDSKSRYKCFYFALKCKRVHNFDLYSCLLQIDANDELIDVLTNLPDLQFSKALQIFLHWPFQDMFLDLVTDFQDHINEQTFYDLVQFILVEKLDCCQDHPYEELFAEFWNLFAKREGEYEDRVKMDANLYNIARYVLDNSKDFDRGKYSCFIEEYLNRISVPRIPCTFSCDFRDFDYSDFDE
ncbi:uncharacterized protein TNCT_173541 [Trichonephila clavata]|uniref:Uncharacterized protein n=1 Tax=Trichonephila clavata TaxID=2740835 RepID=A0A8X6LAH0_TRICU|nr:uncharacterized protein TNCT_173541 [Trichonephila clavata]